MPETAEMSACQSRPSGYEASCAAILDQVHPEILQLKMLKENMYRNGQIKEETKDNYIFLLVLLVSWVSLQLWEITFLCDVGQGGMCLPLLSTRCSELLDLSNAGVQKSYLAPQLPSKHVLS